MKQLTDTEKQELKTKIQKETESMPSSVWKYSFLVMILCLLAFNVFLFLKSLNSDIKNISILNLMVALGLLFNHIAYNFTKTGWKSRVMKIGAWVWIVFVFVYIYVSGIMRFDF